MFHHLLEPIAREFSGKRAWLDVSRLWQFRNTVMTPGLRESCRWCVERFKESGVSARMIPYPADGKTRYGTHPPMPLEWEGKSATLSIVKPTKEARRLTSYEEEALALCCRSASTPKGGVTAQVVILKDGTAEEHYKGLNVRGKIVMTERQASAVASLAAKHGAIGIITDTCDRPRMPQYEPPVREVFDGPDAVQWNCLRGTDDTKHLFGFVLSPRIGARLRKLVETGGRPVVVHAEVDARSYKGHSDVVDAVVPGARGDEELWALAHISEPGAYDNASGLAACIEIGRTLEALYRKKILPRPRRTIRFLFSTEVTGFLPYLEQHKKKWPKVLAGLCIDSVGVDMGKIGGEFVVFRSPDHAPSFIEHLTAEITEAVHNMPCDTFGDNNYALWPWRMEDFWGNDAFITDTYFDIPTPQLSCWPYRYYHTSKDLPEYISADNMARTGVMCAAMLYFLANAGPREAMWTAGLTAGKVKERTAVKLNAEVLQLDKSLGKKPSKKALMNAAARLEQCAEYYGLMGCEATAQALRMAPKSVQAERSILAAIKNVSKAADADMHSAIGLLGDLAGKRLPEPPDEAGPPEAEKARRLVPKRDAWRIPEDKLLPAAQRKKLAALRARPDCKGVSFNDFWPWADGRRSIYEIWRRLRYKKEIPLAVMIDFFEIMTRAKVVKMV
ncbi:MAG: DUF4910 domain-containing protein [Planctomycetes bacterium]|nr:DUF4910 domain-containing protein [Planctomycetota bacterium]